MTTAFVDIYNILSSVNIFIVLSFVVLSFVLLEIYGSNMWTKDFS